MKAVIYKEPKKIAVEDIPMPKIEEPTDIILKVTTAAICGSDMHMYEGRTPAESGVVLGHEIMGVVDQVGDAVKELKKGDRIVLPFNIGCGNCRNCRVGFTSACMVANPEAVGAGYGYVGLGPFNGGQAEYVRVPFADFNALKVPGEPFDTWEDDFILLADILPTGWHALDLAMFEPGGIVVIYGAGPVGLLTAESAFIRGAAKVFVVDSLEDRLALAQKIGAIPINFTKSSSVEQIKTTLKADKTFQESKDPGVEKVNRILYGIDAVGYQAQDERTQKDNPSQVLNNLIELVDPTGHIGIIGVFMPQDPGGVDDEAKQGNIRFNVGLAWNKGLTIGNGQAPVKKYNTQLRDLIVQGKAKPSFIVSHHIDIDEAPDAYEKFDTKVNGYTKIVIQFK